MDTGLNLYGKLTSRDSLGVLAALDLSHRADWMLKARHEVSPTANVALTLINRDSTRLSNRVLVVGEDARRGHQSLDTHWARTWLDGRHVGDTANAFLRYESPRWFAQLAPHYVSPGFRDELGSIPFTAFKGLNASLRYFREWRRGPLRGFSIGGETSDTHHYNGTLFQQQRSVSFDLRSRSNHSLGFGWSGGRFEEFDDSGFNLNLGDPNAREFRRRLALKVLWAM